MTWDDLRDKPKFREVAADIIEFVRGAEWIIHNAPFDIGFLDAELRLAAPAGVHGDLRGPDRHARARARIVSRQAQQPGCLVRALRRRPCAPGGARRAAGRAVAGRGVSDDDPRPGNAHHRHGAAARRGGGRCRRGGGESGRSAAGGDDDRTYGRRSSRTIGSIWRRSTRNREAAVSGSPSTRRPMPGMRRVPTRFAIPDARRLPPEDPDREGLRRRDRVAARSRARAVAPARQPHPAEARGPAAGVLLQAAGRVQQDGAAVAGRTCARRHRRFRRQSCAGRGAGRAETQLHGDDRDAGDHAAHQDRRGRGARREGRAVRRFVQRCVCARAGPAEALARRVRPSLRRSGRHRRAGHGRHGDPAPVPGARSTRSSLPSAVAGSSAGSPRT